MATHREFAAKPAALQLDWRQARKSLSAPAAIRGVVAELATPHPALRGGMV